MPVTISVCAIVKNEEKNIREFIDDVRDFADEIVIVDTGSSDRTIEMVREKSREKGMNIVFDEYEYSGEFHFGKARNYSLKKANMDYILIFDADTRLSREFKTQIKEFLSRENPVVATYKRIDELLPSISVRLEMILKNHQNIFYGEGEDDRIHERLVHDREVKEFPAPVFHCQREGHWLHAPQRILPRIQLEVSRAERGNRSFFIYFLKGIRNSCRKFSRAYFKNKLYKDGWNGLKFSFLKGVYAFLTALFVGLKAKKDYKYWEDPDWISSSEKYKRGES